LHSTYTKMAAQGENYRLAFPPVPKPHISTGLHFPAACAHHITNTYHASKVYVIVSNSISKTVNFEKLQEALGDKIVGVRKGIKPHTPWDDVLEIIHDVRSKGADIIVTLGAGSLTDGAKVISFVRNNPFPFHHHMLNTLPGPRKQRLQH
jgi:alcohol dehydrogenase class IV